MPRTLIRAALEQFVYDMGCAPERISDADYERLEEEAQGIFAATPGKMLDRAGPARTHVKHSLRAILRESEDA